MHVYDACNIIMYSVAMMFVVVRMNYYKFHGLCMLAVIMCLLCVNILNLFKCMLYKCYSAVALLLTWVDNTKDVTVWYHSFKGIKP
jgi:hypothetical protein